MTEAKETHIVVDEEDVTRTAREGCEALRDIVDLFALAIRRSPENKGLDQVLDYLKTKWDDAAVNLSLPSAVELIAKCCLFVCRLMKRSQKASPTNPYIPLIIARAEEWMNPITQASTTPSPPPRKRQRVQRSWIYAYGVDFDMHPGGRYTHAYGTGQSDKLPTLHSVLNRLLDDEAIKAPFKVVFFSTIEDTGVPKRDIRKELSDMRPELKESTVSWQP